MPLGEVHSATTLTTEKQVFTNKTWEGVKCQEKRMNIISEHSMCVTGTESGLMHAKHALCHWAFIFSPLGLGEIKP